MKVMAGVSAGVLLVVALLAVESSPVGAAVNVPLDHWVYRFLDRMWVKGVLRENLSSTRPLSRVAVSRALFQVMKEAKTNPDLLTDVDKDELEWLEMEFAYELSLLGVDPGPRRERNLFRWENGKNHLVCDLIFRGRGVSRSRDGVDYRFLDTIWEPTIRGGLKGNFFYSIDLKKGHIQSRKRTITKEEAGIKGYYTAAGTEANYDIADASFNFTLPWFDLELGKEKLTWGPGYRGNLFLSDNPPSFDFIQLRADYGVIRFTSLLGALRTNVKSAAYQTPDSLFFRTINAQKYIAAHRLEINPHPRVQVGLNEAVVYGERNIDMAYINPLMFFWMAQHNWGDQDNEVLGADLTLRPLDRLLVYSSVIIDELYIGGIFSGNPRNKSAVQLGGHLSAPPGLSNLDLMFDYVRVQPGVYTHKFPVNTFMSWDTPLGYWSGENSDEFFLKAIYRYSRSAWATLFANRLRRGEATPQPYAHNPDPDRYPFLHGVVEKTLGSGIVINYQPVYNLVFSLGFTRKVIANYRHQAGKDVTERELSLRLFVKY